MNLNALRLATRYPKSYPQLRGAATGSRLYSSSSRLCPSCSSPLTTALPTCTKCFHIQTLPRDTSYFDMFDLPQTNNAYKIDTKDLRQRFLQAQRVCHPDAWSGRGEKERQTAEQQSSLLNEAYKTLLSPVTRAQYILTLEGYPPSETDKLTDPTLLMEIMEAREQLEEAETPHMVDDIRSSNNERIKEVNSDIEELIERKEWKQARDAVVKLKYLEGIESAAKSKLETFM